MLSVMSFTPVQVEGTATDSFLDWDFSVDEVLLGSICESVDEMEGVSVGTTVVLSRDAELPAADEQWLPFDNG